MTDAASIAFMPTEARAAGAGTTRAPAAASSFLTDLLLLVNTIRYRDSDHLYNTEQPREISS